jgi:hypothetical protein
MSEKNKNCLWSLTVVKECTIVVGFPEEFTKEQAAYALLTDQEGVDILKESDERYIRVEGIN